MIGRAAAGTAIAASAVAAYAFAAPAIEAPRAAASPTRGCTVAEAAAVVRTFVSAFNRGDAPALAAVLAPPRTTDDVGEDAADGEMGFQWYTDTGPHGVTAMERSRAFVYFTRRHAKGERLRLLMMEVGETWVGTAAAFGIVLRRAAPDLPRRRGSVVIAVGKGELHCGSRTIYVWSVGSGLRTVRNGTPLRVAWICPRPRGWRALVDRPIVCAR